MSFCTFPVRCFGLYTDGCRCREIAGGIPSVGWANCNCPSFECQSVPQCSAVFLEMQRGHTKDWNCRFSWTYYDFHQYMLDSVIIFLSCSYHVSPLSTFQGPRWCLAGSWCYVGFGRNCPSCCPSRATCLRLLGALVPLVVSLGSTGKNGEFITKSGCGISYK